MIVIGIDEVGRGSWAGPLVAAAVALSKPLPGLADSKTLSRRQRQHFNEIIYAHAEAVGLGWVSPAKVDSWGLTKAVGVAMKDAFNAIDCNYDDLVIDGNIHYLPDIRRSRCLVKADQTIQAVSAASIVAKVARDKYMVEQDALYPGYGFGEHVGYGTQKHKHALTKLGVCDLHRLSFRPIIQLNALKS